jgi:hypothetical protein
MLAVPVDRVGEQRDGRPVLVEPVDQQVLRHPGVGIGPALGLPVGLGIARRRDLDDQPGRSNRHPLVIRQHADVSL